MTRQTIYYVAVLIAAFLVLTRWEGANNLIRSGFLGATGTIGVLQGRTVTLGGTSTSVSGLAR